MDKDSSDIRDGIDNELKRVQIQNHYNFPAWYSALKPHARQMIDLILEDDVTPDFILFAQQAPDDEWKEFQFLRVIGGGNPNPDVILALTNVSLGEILLDVDEFRKPKE